MAEQCTEDDPKVGHLPPLNSTLTVQCPIENCHWIGEIGFLEDHRQEKHQAYVFEPIERANSTDLIIPKTYFDKVESLEDKVKKIQNAVLVLREKLTQLKKELSFHESIWLKEIKEEKEKGCSNEPYKPSAYQKVIKKRKEMEEMEKQIKWVERDRHEYEEKLQTLRSNRSKYEEPVRLVDRTPIPSNRQSAASSVASMGLANSQRSLNQERSTDSFTVQNAARSELVQIPESNTHTAVSGAPFVLPSLNLLNPRSSPDVSPTHRRNNITLPSLQFNVPVPATSYRPLPSAGSTGTAVQPRPPRTARPSTGQARSAAPRCHRRRSSLTEPLNLTSNDCPNCAQLQLDLQRSRQTILRLRLNSNAN